MVCEICDKSNCIRSFHSLEEQKEFDTKTGRYAPDEYEEWMNASLGKPTQIPKDIDPDYEQAKVDLTPESPK